MNLSKSRYAKTTKARASFPHLFGACPRPAPVQRMKGAPAFQFPLKLSTPAPCREPLFLYSLRRRLSSPLSRNSAIFLLEHNSLPLKHLCLTGRPGARIKQNLPVHRAPQTRPTGPHATASWPLSPASACFCFRLRFVLCFVSCLTPGKMWSKLPCVLRGFAGWACVPRLQGGSCFQGEALRRRIHR